MASCEVFVAPFMWLALTSSLFVPAWSVLRILLGSGNPQPQCSKRIRTFPRVASSEFCPDLTTVFVLLASADVPAWSFRRICPVLTTISVFLACRDLPAWTVLRTRPSDVRGSRKGFLVQAVVYKRLHIRLME